MKKRSAKLGVLVGIAISGILLFWVLSGLNWGMFFQELARVHPIMIPPLFVLYLISSWIRAKRWRLLLPSGKKLSMLRLFNACVIGNLASYALPLRAGEFVRPWALSRSQPVSFTAGFASIVTERVFDVITMLFLLGLCLSQMENPLPFVTVGAKALGGLAIVIIAVMIIAYCRSQTLMNFCERMCSRLFARMPHVAEKILAVAGEFVIGLKAISSWTDVVRILLWSLALWLEFALIYHTMLLAFGEYPSLWVSQVLNVIIALAIAVPSAPGFIGTFQFGCVTALTGMYHYSQEFAVAYSIFSHSLQVIFTVIVGLYCLRLEGLRFRELSSSPKEADSGR